MAQSKPKQTVLSGKCAGPELQSAGIAQKLQKATRDAAYIIMNNPAFSVMQTYRASELRIFSTRTLTTIRKYR